MTINQAAKRRNRFTTTGENKPPSMIPRSASVQAEIAAASKDHDSVTDQRADWRAHRPGPLLYDSTGTDPQSQSCGDIEQRQNDTRDNDALPETARITIDGRDLH